MHQIQVSAPKGKGEAVAKLALKNGIQQASVQQAYVYGPNKDQEVVTIQTDTPAAKSFVDDLMLADFFNPQDYSIASQTLPAIISSEAPQKITQPFLMPVSDVYQDLWSRNHINPTYLTQAFVSALLLSYGMIQNELLIMAAALLITPFLPQVLAIGFGLLTRQFRLAAQGGLILLLSTVITIISGAIVASLTGGPLQYNSFSPILVNFLISLIVGIVAGFATGDINGRRQLIAFAAAAQFAIYPAWYGIMLVLGLPDAATVTQRWSTYLINVATILVVSVVVYVAMRYRAKAIRNYSQAVELQEE